MKKIISLILALMLVLILLASCGGSSETTSTNVIETTNTETSDTPTPYVPQKSAKIEGSILTSAVGCADSDGVYVVPDYVTYIAEGAFGGDYDVKTVVIGPSVKTIGSGAFAYCTNLQKVTMTDSVESIGSHAFYSCQTLNDITLSKNLTKIDKFCFSECAVLESIVIPEGITRIEEIAFGNCYALSEVTLPSTLEVIGDNAFANCRSLYKINISELTNLQSIGSGAFQYTILRSINIPEGVTEIGSSAFAFASKLTSVKIPSTVKTIAGYAFYGTPYINELTDDDYVIVGDGILLKVNVLPNDINLEGKGIKLIADSAFMNSEASELSLKYGYRYAGQLKKIVIPEGVTVISSNAFMNCYLLEEVVLPSTLETIGGSAFYDDYSSYYPNIDIKIDLSPCVNLKVIGSYAFYGKTGMSETHFGNKIEYVGVDAFGGTKVFTDFEKSVSIRDTSVKFLIDNGVLLYVNVPYSVTTVTIPNGVRVIAGNALCGWDIGQVYTDEQIDSLLPLYRSKYNLTNNVTSITFPYGLEYICDNACYRTSKLTTVVLPDTVKEIYSYAFAGVYSDEVRLQSVQLSNSLTYIGSNAFIYQRNLKSITLPDSLRYVGDGAFGNCGLTSITFPKDCKEFGSELFTVYAVSGSKYVCENLQQMTVSIDVRPEIYNIIGFTTTYNVTYTPN